MFFHTSFDRSRLDRKEIKLLEVYYHQDLVRKLSFAEAVDRLPDAPRNRFLKQKVGWQLESLVNKVRQDRLRQKVPAGFFT